MSLTSPSQEQPPHCSVESPVYLHPQEAALHFDGFVYQPEICRKNCGYYGNPAWHGYCSRCWIQQRQKHQAYPLTDGFRHQTGTLLLKTQEENTKELWKRKDNAGKVTCGANPNNLSYSNTTYRQIPPADVSDAVFSVSWSCLHLLSQGDFSDFLKALRRPDTQQLLTKCTSLIQRLQDAKDLTLDKKGEEVQGFYRRITDLFPDHMIEERDRLLDNVEKLVMTRIYRSVFCLDGSQDEEKDLSLRMRIRSLHWVTLKMLQLPLDEDNQEAKDWVSCAVTAIVEMDSKRAPQDKLTCVSRSSNFLFKAIRGFKQEPASADDFLSCLIYIILKANPPRLISNLQYINRFCNPKRLATGESGYCFTNLCCAVSFIETLDASSLSLTQEEFDRFMQQQTGEASTQNPAVNVIQRMQQNKKLLEELWCRQDILIQKAELLGMELSAWPLSIQEEVQEIISRFPLHTNWTSVSQTKP
ncbi:rab5 GDP/GTP exchange factor-like [Rhinophrynus dorsalis]